MARTVGINPQYLAKLHQFQQDFLITAVGRAFYDEFLTKYGRHLFIFGTTTSGKTNKGYAFLDYMKHLESQVWVSSGKYGETFPLLCMDRKVRIVVPTGVDVRIEERRDGTWQKIKDHPEVIGVETPADMLTAIAPKRKELTNNHSYPDTITIFEIRNAFRKKENAVNWVANLFETLPLWAREGTLSPILPMAMHIDESHWAIAGTRVSNEPERTRASEIIAENAFELRSAAVRLVLYAQGYKNILPTARENMLFNLLCRGAFVSSDENNKLAKWCNYSYGQRPPSPQYYGTHQGRFVFESNHNGWGDSYPPDKPWNFRLYPLSEEDRKWIAGLRITFEGKHDEKTEQDEISEEIFPELGRYAAMAVPPEYKEPSRSRSEMPAGVMVDDDE
jgi:hypothetical protein